MIPCSLQPAHALDIIDAQLANNGRLIESHDPEVTVSGNIVVGVMIENAYEALRNNSIGVSFPGNGNGQSVCLRVSSRDGSYTSENLYRFSAPGTGLVALPYRSSLQAIIEEYTSAPGSIAMTATRGTCDDSSISEYLLPAILDRTDRSLRAGKLALYINSIDATDVYYRVATSGTQEFSDCAYIEEGRHTAYNFLCEIDYPVRSTDAPVLIEIEREIYGRSAGPALAIRLLSPGGNAQ